MFYYFVQMATIINSDEGVIAVADDRKFIVTPKEPKSVTMTIRINSEINAKLERLSQQSNRSRNELINQALAFALDHLEFVDSE